MPGSCQGLNKFRKQKWKKFVNFLKLTLLETCQTSENEELFIVSNTSIRALCMATPPLSTQETLQSNLLLSYSIIFTLSKVLLNQSKNFQSYKLSKRSNNFPSKNKNLRETTTKAVWRNLSKTRKSTFQNLLPKNRQVRNKKRSHQSRMSRKRRRNKPRTTSRDKLNIIHNKLVRVYWVRSSLWSDWLRKMVMTFQNWQTTSKRREIGLSLIGNSSQESKSFIECLRRFHLYSLFISLQLSTRAHSQLFGPRRDKKSLTFMIDHMSRKNKI